MRSGRTIEKRALKVREQIETRMVKRSGPYTHRWVDAPPFEKATRLVLLADYTLLFIIGTAIDRPSDSKRARQDEKALVESFKDLAAVERCWIFLAHGVAARSRADGNAHARDDEMLTVLRESYPLEAEDVEALEHGLGAVELGAHTPPVVFSRHALSVLVGAKRADAFALFDPDEFEGDWFEIERALEISWDHAETHYATLAETGQEPDA